MRKSIISAIKLIISKQLLDIADIEKRVRSQFFTCYAAFSKFDTFEKIHNTKVRGEKNTYRYFERVSKELIANPRMAEMLQNASKLFVAAFVKGTSVPQHVRNYNCDH